MSIIELGNIDEYSHEDAMANFIAKTEKKSCVTEDDHGHYF